MPSGCSASSVWKGLGHHGTLPGHRLPCTMCGTILIEMRCLFSCFGAGGRRQ